MLTQFAPSPLPQSANFEKVRAQIQPEVRKTLHLFSNFKQASKPTILDPNWPRVKLAFPRF